MKLSNRQIIEVVSVLGVIGSLIFVGLQLRLDRQLAISEQYHNRAESRLESLRTSLSNSDNVRDRALRWETNKPSWWSDEIETAYEDEFESMDALVRSTTNFSIFLVAFDNNYFQYQQGLLDEGFWESLREDMKNAMRAPIPRANTQSTALSEGTQLLIEELILEVDEGR